MAALAYNTDSIISYFSVTTFDLPTFHTGGVSFSVFGTVCLYVLNSKVDFKRLNTKNFRTFHSKSLSIL